MTGLLGCLLGALCGFIAPYWAMWSLQRVRASQKKHFAEMSERYRAFVDEFGHRPSRKGEGDERYIALWAVDAQEAATFGELTEAELSVLRDLDLPLVCAKPAPPMRFEFHPSIMFRGVVAVAFSLFGLLTFYLLPSSLLDKEFLLLFALFASVMTMTDFKARVISFGVSIGLLVLALLHQLIVHGVEGALWALGVAMAVTLLAWLLGKALEAQGKPSPVGGGDLLFLFGVGCATGLHGILMGAVVSAVCAFVPLTVGFATHKLARDTYVPMAMWLGLWMIAGCIIAQAGVFA